MSTITDAFRAARISAQLTQRDIAALMGVTPQYVNDIEHGKRELPQKHYERLPINIMRAVIYAALAEIDKNATSLHMMLDRQNRSKSLTGTT